MNALRQSKHRPGTYPSMILALAEERGRICTADIAAFYGAVAPSYRYSMISTALRTLVRRKELVFCAKEGRREYFKLPTTLDTKDDD